MLKHGQCQTRTYHLWESMIQRCNNANCKHYKNYGGRGITVCEEWKEFINFWDDMYDCPDGYVLDRIDNDKGYNPENCQWVPRAKAKRIIRSNAVYYTIDNETLCARHWSVKMGKNPSYIGEMRYRGKSQQEIEEIIRKEMNG
jgi:hypothetical protein